MTNIDEFLQNAKKNKTDQKIIYPQLKIVGPTVWNEYKVIVFVLLVFCEFEKNPQYVFVCL